MIAEKNKSYINYLIAIKILALTILTGTIYTPAQNSGISISPPRIEVVVPAGTEKTVGITVDYTSDNPQEKLPIARIVARLEDWTVDEQGELRFAPVGTLSRSAKPFITYSPAEFALDGAGRQVVRLTFAIPAETPAGDYLIACYFEGRDNPPPPGSGVTAQIYVRFRYYSLIYVKVPGLSHSGELTALNMKVVNGKPVIIPKMENSGNSVVRPKHLIEIRDASDKIVFSSPLEEATAILGKSKWEKPYPINVALPSGDYTLFYTTDFGENTALRKAKLEFNISDEDVALRNSLESKDKELSANSDN